MELNLEFNPPSGVFVVPVPSEKLGGPSANVKTIKFGGKSYNVKHVYTYAKEDYFPVGMMFIATGLNLTAGQVWKKYKNSKYLHFFVVKLKSK